MFLIPVDFSSSGACTSSYINIYMLLTFSNNCWRLSIIVYFSWWMLFNSVIGSNMIYTAPHKNILSGVVSCLFTLSDSGRKGATIRDSSKTICYFNSKTNVNCNNRLELMECMSKEEECEERKKSPCWLSKQYFAPKLCIIFSNKLFYCSHSCMNGFR